MRKTSIFSIVQSSFLIVLLTGAIILSSHVSFSVPWSVALAPITAQTLIISILVYVSNKWLINIAIVLFILLGLVGLPVYADGACCWETLSGNSGGYIFGFLIGSVLLKWYHQDLGKSILEDLHFMVLYTAYVLLCGFIYLSLKIGALSAWHYGVKPFLFGAIIKILLGLVVITVLKSTKVIKS